MVAGGLRGLMFSWPGVAQVTVLEFYNLNEGLMSDMGFCAGVLSALSIWKARVYFKTPAHVGFAWPFSSEAGWQSFPNGGGRGGLLILFGFLGALGLTFVSHVKR